MAPAYLGGVLRGGVLCIVDEKICAVDECDMAQVLPCDIPLTASQAPRVRLVITAIYNGRAIRLEPVSERQRRMV
jgi:hypothetical protein